MSENAVKKTGAKSEKKKPDEKKPVTKSYIIKWIIAVLVPLIIFMVPTGDAFTGTMKAFLVLTSLFILLIAFELMPTMIPSIMLPFGYLMFSVSEPEVIYAAWHDAMPWMFLAIFIIAGVFTRVGLINRVAYWCISKIGGGFKGLCAAILIAGILLSIVLPGGNAHAPLIFCVFGICIAMGWGKGPNKEATVLMMLVLLGTYSTTKFILNPYMYLIEGLGAPYELGDDMNFFTYLYHNWIYLVWIVIAAVLIYKLIGPKGEMHSKEYFKEKYREMGKLSTDEKKAAICALILVALVMTTSLHGIAMGWCFVIAAFIMFLPFIKVANEDDIKGVNYSIVFFVAACMCIGDVGSSVGFGQLIANTIVPYMHGISDTGFFLIVLLIGGLGNFVLTPLAILATFTGPITQIAAELGINHLSAWYTLSVSTNLLMLPYEYIAYLFTYSFGLMTMKDFVKVYSIKSILLILFTLFIAVPWWKFVGIV